MSRKRPHLVTVVGGHIETLKPMLEHYRRLGVEDFHVMCQMAAKDDPVRGEVDAITNEFGCGIARTYIGEWQMVQREAYWHWRRDYPDEWYVLADQDELTLLPMPLDDLVALCEAEQADAVEGCFVDRIASDGGFPEWDGETTLWEAFPLACLLSLMVLWTNPRKMVLVRGALSVAHGQHMIEAGKILDVTQCYAQVHHFKWTAGVVDRLERRSRHLRAIGVKHWEDSYRFVDAMEKWGGRVLLEIPELLVASGGHRYEDYARWPEVAQFHWKLRKT